MAKLKPTITRQNNATVSLLFVAKTIYISVPDLDWSKYVVVNFVQRRFIYSIFNHQEIIIQSKKNIFATLILCAIEKLACAYF